ncbi:MAG: Rrf2 family transcriptional regulator [Elusimicrobia bacterium]|nr:Rrf2 family transcriptional regulator [Elusimicrobiota bacterium]
MNKTLAYGLACLHYLDEHRSEKWARVSEIAKFQNLPLAYCNKVLQALIHAGFVYSQKGKGYRLGKKLDNISVWNLMEAFTFNSAPEPKKKGVSIKLYDTLKEEVDHWLIGLSVSDIVEIMKAEKERKRGNTR